MKNELKGLQIALTSEMRGGKDTVGKYLVDHYGFQRYAFGDGIVKTAKKLFPEAFENGEKPRKLLQDFGQYCVSIDKMVWVRYLFREMLYDGIDPLEDNVVITDLRQPHEYEHLVESGFTIARVNTDAETRIQRILDAGETYDPETFNHSTEKFVRTFEVDFEFDNNFGKNDLFDQVDNFINDLTGGGF